MFRTPLTLDRAHRGLTIFFGALVTAGVIAMWLADSVATRRGGWALLGTFVLCFAMSPRALVVENGVLRIERRLWPPLRIPLADVEHAEPLDALGKRVLRIGGVGGFFGSFGMFWSDKLRGFRLYATRRGQAVVVVRRGRLWPIVVTPDDVAGAIAAIDPRPALGAYRSEPGEA